MCINLIQTFIIKNIYDLIVNTIFILFQSTEEEDEKLIRILHKQRQHKEQFLNEMSQAPPCEISESSRGPSNAMTQSYHFKTQTSPQKQEVDMSMSTSCIVPSKIMYESGNAQL